MKYQRKKIKNLVEEIASKNISLICINLKKDIDINYAKFKEIYQNHKNNCIFDIVPISKSENLFDLADKAIKVYKTQRSNEIN